MKVLECKPDVGGFKDCGVVFSGLDQDVAGDIGESGRHSVMGIQPVRIP
jgi:aspartate-semialdehyde dehydrogenase